MAKGDSGKSQLLIRNYAMERFLERVALSKYKDNFILKGGMLVSALVGLQNRTTMDIDTTIRNLPLDSEQVKQIVEEIAAVEVDDNIHFIVKDVSNIMEETEYGGVRLSLDAFLDITKIPLKIDISTGDVVTPDEIFNTRLRDFYDLYILQHAEIKIDTKTLAFALKATCCKRNSEKVLPEYRRILNEIQNNSTMQTFWYSYQKKNSYAADITWETVMNSIQTLCDSCIC